MRLDDCPTPGCIFREGHQRSVCRDYRLPRCGAWMPHAREGCARSAGHGYEHRSAYSLANARRAQRERLFAA